MIKKIRLTTGSMITAYVESIKKVSPAYKIRRENLKQDEIIIENKDKVERDFSSYLEEETEKFFNK